MAASYYVSTDDGRVHHIAQVTASPTIVVNDGVATTVFDGYYRDVYGYSNTGAQSASVIPFGPGWSMYPTYGGSPLSITDWTVVPDDMVTHEPPRFLEVKKSYWKFVTADGAYFFPIERVVGMSNNAPTY